MFSFFNRTEELSKIKQTISPGKLFSMCGFGHFIFNIEKDLSTYRYKVVNFSVPGFILLQMTLGSRLVLNA